MLRIGNVQLDSPALLAPMAGHTDLPFRLLCRELGGVGLASTDLLNSRSVLRECPKAMQLAATCEADSPLCMQLYGNDQDPLPEAALWAVDHGAMIVDINMGCPVRKVVKTGGGSAMMTELDKTHALVRGMVDALKIPVTAKMRLGWDDQNLTAPDLARTLQDAGIAAIFVHGRTRAQGFEGTVNLEGIRKVVEAVPDLPVVGNGDVTTTEAAKLMFEATGCAGVSIGRGAFYNPWIFKHTQHYIETGELLPEPTFDERIRVLRRHYDLMLEVFGENRGSVMFRKVAPWYAKRFGPAKPFNKAVVQISTREDFETVLADYLDWREKFTDTDGQLLPHYQLPPMGASFMQEPETAVEKRKAIPVPKGPVEVW